MQKVLSPFQSTTSNWACSSGGDGSSPGFPASLPRTELNNPGRTFYNQPPCLSLSWPLLSLSESVSIAGNPGSSTSRLCSFLSRNLTKGRAPLFTRKTNRSPGSQGVGVGLGAGLWAGSWLSPAHASQFHLADPAAWPAAGGGGGGGASAGFPSPLESAAGSSL